VRKNKQHCSGAIRRVDKDRRTVLAARGRADLRVREEAEEWLKKGLDFYHKRDTRMPLRVLSADSTGSKSPRVQNSLGALYDGGLGLSRTAHKQRCGIARPRNREFDSAMQPWRSVPRRPRLPQDYAEAVVWWHKAADKEMPLLTRTWKCVLRRPRGTQDHAQAAVWWSMAANR